MRVFMENPRAQIAYSSLSVAQHSVITKLVNVEEDGFQFLLSNMDDILCVNHPV